VCEGVCEARGNQHCVIEQSATGTTSKQEAVQSYQHLTCLARAGVPHLERASLHALSLQLHGLRTQRAPCPLNLDQPESPNRCSALSYRQRCSSASNAKRAQRAMAFAFKRKTKIKQHLYIQTVPAVTLKVKKSATLWFEQAALR
jgi:hypothetical protein